MNNIDCCSGPKYETADLGRSTISSDILVSDTNDFNMSEQGKLEPHRITKPIQLLAAWLLGLIIVNDAFLIAAGQIEEPIWIPSALVVAAIVNVPIFLISIFLLQTKFRPEMQEDSFYSQYLESKTGNTEREVTAESVSMLREHIASLEALVSEDARVGLNDDEITKLKWSSVTVGLNKNLDNFADIAKRLTRNGLPVHETFGSGADSPAILNVAIGSGFDIEQIQSLIDAILPISDGWISFAHDEDEGPGQYDNQVLIGAYGNYNHGIKLSKAKSLLTNKSASDAYKVFGE